MVFEIPMNPPTALTSLAQWVCHKKKVPISFRGKAGSSTNPSTWGTFDQCVNEAVHWNNNPKGVDGVGFVFSDDDPFIGIDLDKVIDADGKLEEWAQEWVDKLDSYTEYSPSGRGLHVFIQGKLPTTGKRGSRFEVYQTARFFTFTGKPYKDYGDDPVIESRQEEIEWLLDKYRPGWRDERTSGQGVDVDIGTALPTGKFIALRDNSKKFKQTWDHTRADFKDQSLSSYDLSLAMQTMHAGWTDGEVVALIIEHRSHYGDEQNKAGRMDYLERTLRAAKDYLQKDVKDSDAAIKATLESASEAEPEDILGDISSRLQLSTPITKIIKRGTDPAEYFFGFGENQVLVGETDQLFSPRFVKNKLFEHLGEVIPKKSQDEWDCLISLMQKVMVYEAVGSRFSETMDAVSDYLENTFIYEGESWKEGLEAKDPFSKDGMTWINISKFHMHVEASRCLPSGSSRKLKTRLIQCEFVSRVFTASVNGQQKCRTYLGKAVEKSPLVKGRNEVKKNSTKIPILGCSD